MSFRYVPDDEVVPSVAFEADDVVRDGETDYSSLEELGVSAQRLVQVRSAKKYASGSAKRVVSFDQKTTGEKMFRVDKLIEWVSGEPDVLVEECRKGRLRCRLSAAMGMGKSTRMPSYLAKQLDVRVLYVALDAVALQQVVDYVHGNGIGKFSRAWSSVSKARLVGMTYADFNGHMSSSSHKELFRSFEVIVFDEAFMDTPDVFAAKRAFSVFSLQDTSLILCSATIKRDDGGEGGASSSLGNFKQTRTVTVDEAISSGKLCEDYLADRSVVFVPDDHSVSSVAEHYCASGVDVYSLDSAATFEDFFRVYESMVGDSTTPRVLVSHMSHGIGFNIPVSQPLIFPFEQRVSFDGDLAVTDLVPMTEAYVTQCKSRSGRGIVEGSGGVVFGGDRREALELCPHRKMEAFVRLFAMNIVPSVNGFWQKQYEMFPKGMSHALANSLLKICLPVEVAIRYFGRDGLPAKKYCAALNVFSQTNHFLQASSDELPSSAGSWAREDLLTVEGVTVPVPVRAQGELQIIIHVIEAMSTGVLAVPKWVPSVAVALGDGYDSGEEKLSGRGAVSPRLRRIEDKPLPPVAAIETRAVPWQYSSVGESSRRSGGIIDSVRVQEALRSLERHVDAYRVGAASIGPVVESGGESAVEVVYGDGVVESPGGSAVCVLPLDICEKMNEGKVLTGAQMVEVIGAARGDSVRFVASKMFDNYARPWDSMVQTMMSDTAISVLAKRGLSSDAYVIVDCLRRRFTVETCNVMAGSNVYKTTFLRVFHKFPSFDSVMKAVNAGRFDGVAQTEGFLQRIRQLKVDLDRVLLQAERVGVYLPTQITHSQRQLPLRGQNVLGYEGDGLHKMPKEWSERIGTSSGESLIKFPLGKNK